MFLTKRPYPLQDQITVDFLESTYIDHQEIAEELALSEIHSIQLAMPKFNTVASLTKMEFTKLLGKIKYKCKDVPTFMVMVAAISDTFTCMIENSKFYDSFNGNNTIGLELMIDLLHSVKLLFLNCRPGVETKQLETLTDILEKSAQRIQNNEEHYKIMQQIISSLKTCMLNRLDKENKLEMKKVATKIESEDGNKAKPNGKGLKSPLLTPNTKQSIKIEDKKPLIKSPSIALPKYQIVNKKQNAFELMMISSKNLSKKRKLK